MNTEAPFGRFPVIKSDRLILDKIGAEHLEEVFEIYDNDKVFTYCRHHSEA